MTKFRDFPIDDVAKQANERIDAVGGRAIVHQKWTCRHCGSRQTMEDKNVFHRSGRCEECGNITVISKCNYVMILGDQPEGAE